MPKTPEALLGADATAILHQHANLAHLRVRARGKVITIESGDPDDPVPHARFRRVTTQYWQLEMPLHTGRWEPTPVRGILRDVLDILITDFGWALEPLNSQPLRTSDPRY